MLPVDGVVYTCPYRELAWQHRNQECRWKDLAGNAMHTGLLGMVMTYFLCGIHVVDPDSLQLFQAACSGEQEADERAT